MRRKRQSAGRAENQEVARLTNKPIRWIMDDAMKFVLREERRGSSL